jgi:hypothetical protein
LTNENVAPGASIGTVIGTWSATITGGGPCTTCTWSMVTSGTPTGQPGPGCSSVSNNFKVVGSGATATFEVAVSGLTQQVFGHPPFGSAGSPCVMATPAVGSSYTWAFSVMVRGPTFTSIEPLTVQYTPGITAGNLVATMSGTVHSGSFASSSLSLGGDTMCGNIAVSGLNLVVASGKTLTTQAGVCHVIVSQSGVNCSALGSLTATPATCTAAVMIEPSSYIGPGDVTYANGAAGLPWTKWSEPYAYSAAYAAPGTHPIWTVIRDKDGPNSTYFTAVALSNGDMDLAGLANFCDTSVCLIADNPNTSVAGEPDQSGHSPANDVHAWADLPGHGCPSNCPVTIWRPQIVFNAINGVMPMKTNDNGTDQFSQDIATYNGSGTTGTIETVAEAYSTGGIYQTLATLNDIDTAAPDSTRLEFTSTVGNAQLYVGPDNYTGGTAITATNATAGAFHSFLGVANGTTTNGSLIEVDGVAVTGTFPSSPAPDLILPFYEGGGPGGGSLTGLISGSGVSPNAATTPQLQALCQFHQQHFGTGGTC